MPKVSLRQARQLLYAFALLLACQLLVTSTLRALHRRERASVEAYAALYADAGATPGLPGYGQPRGAALCVARSPKRFDDAYVTAMVRDTCGSPTDAAATRLRAVAYLARAALTDTVTGDFVETGAHTDGAAALLLRTLREYDTCGRRVWVFPRANDTLEEVEAVTDAFRLRVVRGGCNATCAGSGVGSVAVLRVSGRTFDDAVQPLMAFYDRLASGGYVYVDDYYESVHVKRAVDAFRSVRGVWEPLNGVTGSHASTVHAAWWQRRY